MSLPVLVYVNNKPVYIPANSTVINACDKLDVVVPRFCYHDLLEIAGNCRICLVEIEKSPKPIASCGLPVIDQMRIYTNTPLVKKAREGVIEFLLLNHPLDCPICDQGGECDLQDQARSYGNNSSRFYLFKRGVEDKNLNYLIKTIITRCIHCTRCVRFASEIGGFDDLGTTLRGNKTEITTYVEKTLNSEVSLNIVDLCPVGALTSKTYAFKARPWEVKSTKAIDISDSLGSNITYDSKKNIVLRAIPRTNLKINIEWLSDIARYRHEGYTYIRLKNYYIRRENNRFEEFSSPFKLNKIIISSLFKEKTIQVTVGRNLDFKALLKIKTNGRKLGADLESESFLNFPLTFLSFNLSNESLDKIEHTSDAFFLGVNPRLEATIANLHLRKRFKKGLYKVYTFGCYSDYSYKSKYSGVSFKEFFKTFLGKNCNSLNTYKKALIAYGNSLTERYDGISLLCTTSYYLSKVSYANLTLIRYANGSNSTGKSFLGLNKLSTFSHEKHKLSYNIGIENDETLIKSNAPIIYESSHMITNLKKANFILPIQSYLEKNSFFANHDGNLQESNAVIHSGFETFNLFKDVISKYQDKFGFNLKSFQIIKSKYILKKRHFKKNFFNFAVSLDFFKVSQKKKKFKIAVSPMKSYIGNLYIKDLPAKASLTLAKLSHEHIKSHWNFSN